MHESLLGLGQPQHTGASTGAAAAAPVEQPSRRKFEGAAPSGQRESLPAPNPLGGGTGQAAVPRSTSTAPKLRPASAPGALGAQTVEERPAENQLRLADEARPTSRAKPKASPEGMPKPTAAVKPKPWADAEPAAPATAAAVIGPKTLPSGRAVPGAASKAKEAVGFGASLKPKDRAAQPAVASKQPAEEDSRPKAEAISLPGVSEALGGKAAVGRPEPSSAAEPGLKKLGRAKAAEGKTSRTAAAGSAGQQSAVLKSVDLKPPPGPSGLGGRPVAETRPAAVAVIAQPARAPAPTVPAAVPPPGGKPGGGGGGGGPAAADAVKPVAQERRADAAVGSRPDAGAGQQPQQQKAAGEKQPRKRKRDDGGYTKGRGRIVCLDNLGAGVTKEQIWNELHFLKFEGIVVSFVVPGFSPLT